MNKISINKDLMAGFTQVWLPGELVCRLWTLADISESLTEMISSGIKGISIHMYTLFTTFMTHSHLVVLESRYAMISKGDREILFI